MISYRDLQKSGKDLNADQKVAVAKYDEVNQTLEFARDLSKQITNIALSAEREAKKQAKRVCMLYLINIVYCSFFKLLNTGAVLPQCVAE